MGHVALSAGLAKLSANEYLVMAGTLHGVHAITSRISPVPKSSGVQTIEAETFKMTILLTRTGERLLSQVGCLQFTSLIESGPITAQVSSSYY
jgi:hypothetical protein